jgi:hypothetical protein
VVGDLPARRAGALAAPSTAGSRRRTATPAPARARLGEAHELCEGGGARAPSHTDLLPVAAPLFEMLSPYLDDAMAPVLAGHLGQGRRRLHGAGRGADIPRARRGLGDKGPFRRQATSASAARRSTLTSWLTPRSAMVTP